MNGKNSIGSISNGSLPLALHAIGEITLTGTDMDDNKPPSNDYSGVPGFLSFGHLIVNINCPINLSMDLLSYNGIQKLD